jgi:cyclopropane fatty-acyl-phospholipid synthase-like methyltransferase
MPDLERATEDYYRETLLRHGDTARGVDWKSSQDQGERFDRILDLARLSRGDTILDVGCGTGALWAHLKERHPDQDLRYTGLDLVREMIEAARLKFGPSECSFVQDNLHHLEGTFDHVVASGIFNVRQGVDETIWEEYILQTLQAMFDRSKKSMVFNILTGYVDFRVDKLYYCDPRWMMDQCVRRFSRRVLLDHSYPLYEYTLAVYRVPPVGAG